MKTCNTCRGETVQKSRWRLLLVGSALSASVVLAVVGVYLILWATLGKGLWCRQCKTFRV